MLEELLKLKKEKYTEASLFFLILLLRVLYFHLYLNIYIFFYFLLLVPLVCLENSYPFSCLPSEGCLIASYFRIFRVELSIETHEANEKGKRWVGYEVKEEGGKKKGWGFSLVEKRLVGLMRVLRKKKKISRMG